MARDELREAAGALAAATARRNALIVAEYAAGESLRTIAERAGVSHQTVKNIIDRATG